MGSSDGGLAKLVPGAFRVCFTRLLLSHAKSAAGFYHRVRKSGEALE